MEYHSGDCYVGDWLQSPPIMTSAVKPNGRGIMTFANGDKYTGLFESGQRHGQGVMTSASGAYDGAWVDGKRSGEGTWQTKGGKYSGTWVNDQRSGHGLMRYDHGDRVYQGHWEAGLPAGQGTYWYDSSEDGGRRTYVGEVKGVMHAGLPWPQPHGQGTMWAADGSQEVVGRWADGAKVPV